MTVAVPPVCDRCADEPGSAAKIEQHVDPHLQRRSNGTEMFSTPTCPAPDRVLLASPLDYTALENSNSFLSPTIASAKVQGKRRQAPKVNNTYSLSLSDTSLAIESISQSSWSPPRYSQSSASATGIQPQDFARHSKQVQPEQCTATTPIAKRSRTAIVEISPSPQRTRQAKKPGQAGASNIAQWPSTLHTGETQEQTHIPRMSETREDACSVSQTHTIMPSQDINPAKSTLFQNLSSLFNPRPKRETLHTKPKESSTKYRDDAGTTKHI
jgi:hypothetical protein